MEQYILKSALVAEIERRIKDWRYGSSTEAKFKREECDDILSFIDTLEVKDVDLNDAVERYVDQHKSELSGYFDIRRIAKHFFELGLKMKKE